MTTKLSDVLGECLNHFYHTDCANAAIHMADVRFSPITFRLAEALRDSGGDVTPEMYKVLDHVGMYPEDRGR